MRSFKNLFVALLFSIPLASVAQKDTLSNKLDSLSKKTDSAGRQINNIQRNAYNDNTQITFRSYFQLLGSDLKQEFTKPFHMNGKDWGRFAKFAVVAVGVGVADEPIQRNTVDFMGKHTGLQKVSSYVTKFGSTYEIYTLAAFGAYGVIFKSDKMRTTTLLATQAFITGGAVESVMKYLSGRVRPSAYIPGSTETEPRFYGPFSKRSKTINGSKEYSSFPSGHTTVAFAAATVFAKEYSNTVYVPIIAYSAATLIGISRLTENKHWATDVLVGAALGYLSGKQVVNNYHRYSKLKAPQQPKNTTVSWHLDYNFGKVMPGVTYSFK